MQACRGRRPGAWWLRLGLAVLVAGAAGSCGEGRSPTEPAPEITPVEPAASLGEASHGGEIVGCVPGAELVTLDSDGNVHYFLPDADACVTRLGHGRRTMEVNLMLPPGVTWPAEILRFGFPETGWYCPIPGPQWKPVIYTIDWGFRVTPSGHLTGRCHAHDY